MATHKILFSSAGFLKSILGYFHHIFATWNIFWLPKQNITFLNDTATNTKLKIIKREGKKI